LQSSNLIPYHQQPFILHVVAMLIIAGGLSPTVILSAPRLFRRAAHSPVSAQVKLALSSSGWLLLGGFCFILVIEWNNTLETLSWGQRLHNAWFQSVTLRTAGFHSIDLIPFKSATVLLCILWMYVGGSPGGTAGGIKTTTLSVLVLSAARAIRGQVRLNVFAKNITERTLHKAIAVAILALTVLLLGTIAILLTQVMSTEVALFEVASALGTVGLSIGGTLRLDGVGKLIIISIMFIGRVGPLTLLMFMGRGKITKDLKRPEEEMDVT
jgi:trk system potassium uptake protein TrkH